MCICCLVAKSCLTFLWPMDCSLPGSSVHGISQARILEWVAISFSRGSSWSRDQIWVYCLAGGFFTIEPTGKPSTSCSGWSNCYFLNIFWVFPFWCLCSYDFHAWDVPLSHLFMFRILLVLKWEYNDISNFCCWINKNCQLKVSSNVFTLGSSVVV